MSSSQVAATELEETAVTHAQITDRELDRLRALLGTVVNVSERPYLTEITRDAVSNWVYATGDCSPAYRPFVERDSTPSAGLGLTAPPALLYACSRLSIGYRGGLPGVHSMFGGSHLHFERPLRLGQPISAVTTFTGLDELTSRFAGRMFKQISTTEFSDGEGPVGSITGWGMRLERTTARRRGKLKEQVLQSYTPDEIADIAAGYAQERTQEFSERSIASVQVGDQTAPLLRGPYTGTTAVAFEQAWGGLFVRAHAYWYDKIAKHPALGLLNANSVPEPPEAVHWSSDLARSVGVPDAYDYGPERISWMAVMLGYWAGPSAFLEDLYCEIRAFNVFGDLTYLQGTVTAVDPETATVTLDVDARNQRGEVTVRGWARVRLAG